MYKSVQLHAWNHKFPPQKHLGHYMFLGGQWVFFGASGFSDSLAPPGQWLPQSNVKACAGTAPQGEPIVVCLALLFLDRNIRPCHHHVLYWFSSGRLGLFQAQRLFPNMLMSRSCGVWKTKMYWVAYELTIPVTWMCSMMPYIIGTLSDCITGLVWKPTLFSLGSLIIIGHNLFVQPASSRLFVRISLRCPLIITRYYIIRDVIVIFECQVTRYYVIRDVIVI